MRDFITAWDKPWEKLRHCATENPRKVVAGAVMVATLVCLPLRLSRAVTFCLCIAFVWAASKVFKVGRLGQHGIRILAAIFIYCFAWYVTSGFHMAEMLVYDTPFLPLPEVNAVVVPGGDSLVYQYDTSSYIVSVCFYVPGSDLFVIAGHRCEIPQGVSRLYTRLIPEIVTPA
ncbi:MAG TPA: hypothetical protein GX529_04655, partial [Firmicutes bacterium]|nr:hypothetical protein [Candidatus Fermentithermobacillaceae bacterium]